MDKTTGYREEAVLVVSHGTSHKSAREKAIQPMEELVRQTFGDWRVETAYTSVAILKKLREQGVGCRNPEEALEMLWGEGFRKVAIQPLHLVGGYEFDKVGKAAARMEAKGMRVCLGAPLLDSGEDYMQVLDALQDKILEEKGGMTLLAGHGTSHEANSVYGQLESLMHARGWPALMGTLEEGVEAVLPRLGKAERVRLLPFLLVAGDHVMNDLAGGEEHSWSSILKERGVAVECVLEGLGENPGIRAIYLRHLEKALDGLADGAS
ncbi:sirohydrochlorin cobaltochelatase [Anaerotalea alkaliphila]|uniref:Sirohydrochlorin cobaltochelatase n=1 Tax=Anaerotalea alkaliphila TaxID=2662126 RepID=A0A7X5HT79_9FIRM|nr:sirohydrochlorin cobaltochelatase [Anaerotalea alkaliphila]NDL66232.1 sirohydrochlorin cobaltochelatase [Anaerotalea alkaliphila]